MMLRTRFVEKAQTDGILAALSSQLPKDTNLKELPLEPVKKTGEGYIKASYDSQDLADKLLSPLVKFYAVEIPVLKDFDRMLRPEGSPEGYEGWHFMYYIHSVEEGCNRKGLQFGCELMTR